MDINIPKIVSLYNDDGMNINAIAKKLNVSVRTIQRKMKSEGYYYDRGKKKYVKQIKVDYSHSDLSERPKSEEPKNDFPVVRTYTIPKNIDKAIKFKSIIEDKYANDIVAEALEKYIENKYFNMDQ